MRHKYPTSAIVLQRAPFGDASALLTLITRDVGLVRARAQGVRKPGAKLSAALATLAESDVILVAGKEGWRISGAHLSRNWFAELPRLERARAARLSALMLRLVSGESPDPRIFDSFKAFLEALAALPEELHDAAECLAALRLLSPLGLDAGDIPGDTAAPLAEEPLAYITEHRSAFIARVNRGIAASGL